MALIVVATTLTLPVTASGLLNYIRVEYVEQLGSSGWAVALKIGYVAMGFLGVAGLSIQQIRAAERRLEFVRKSSSKDEVWRAFDQ